MRILAACLLVELALVIADVACRGFIPAALTLVIMAGQIIAGAAVWDHAQAARRRSYAFGMLRIGYSHDQAQMAANYEYPDVRVFVRLAKDFIRSHFGRKGAKRG